MPASLGAYCCVPFVPHLAFRILRPSASGPSTSPLYKAAQVELQMLVPVACKLLVTRLQVTLWCVFLWNTMTHEA